MRKKRAFFIFLIFTFSSFIVAMAILNDLDTSFIDTNNNNNTNEPKKDIIHLEKKSVSWQQRELFSNLRITGPSGLAFKDINNDSILDVVGCSFIDNYTYVYISNNWEKSLVVNKFLSVLDIADIDNDTDLDIIGHFNKTIYWYENGNNWFERRIGNSTGDVKHIVCKDIEFDGDIDVIISNYEGNSDIFWYENGNNWQRELITSDYGGDGARYIGVDDLDCDNDLDIITLHNDYPDDLYWYENGNSWASHIIGTTSWHYYYGGTTGDLTNDNVPDIISGSSSGRIFWYENINNGSSFSEKTIGSFSISYGWGHVQVGEVNMDSCLDIIGRGGINNEIRWYDNNNSWASNYICKPNNSYNFFYARDYDSDSDTDVILVEYNASYNGTLILLENKILNPQSNSRNYNFSVRWEYPATSCTDIELGILQGSYMDVVFSNYSGNGITAINENGQILWSQNLGNGAMWLDIADLESDGIYEVLSAVYNTGIKIYHGNNGTLYWSAPAGGNVQFVEAANINSDSNMEVGFVSGRLYAYNSTGDYLWESSSSGGYAQMTHGDVNGDGVDEFIYNWHSGSSLIIYAYWGNGTLIWSRSFTFPTAYNRQGLCIDFDNDGRDDYVFPFQNGTIAMFDGRNGSVIWEVSYPNAEFGYADTTIVTDINNDGKEELILVDISTNYNSCYCINTTQGNEIWHFQNYERFASTIAVGDFENDGEKEVAFGSASYIGILNAVNGELIFKYEDDGAHDSIRVGN
ncbi:MAG: FG-GAP-like repeat-containing protein, partial [Candidatus Helarchaeota archaeon]